MAISRIVRCSRSFGVSLGSFGLPLPLLLLLLLLALVIFTLGMILTAYYRIGYMLAIHTCNRFMYAKDVPAVGRCR